MKVFAIVNTLFIMFGQLSTLPLLRLSRVIKISNRNLILADKRFSLQGRKIEDEEKSLQGSIDTDSRKPTNIKRRGNGLEEKHDLTEKAVEKAPGPISETNYTATTSASSEFEIINPKYKTPATAADKEASSFANSNTLQNPFQQNHIPPEIMFFGEPRQPPPPSAASDSKYHGTFLMWARHATVAPQDSASRKSLILPLLGFGLIENFSDYRLDPNNSSFSVIFNRFKDIMLDLEASKRFIMTNLDFVPPILFLRALTAKKLLAQFENDLGLMNQLKDIRNSYLVAHDQLFFPLNLEVRKAETRVMTYITRGELENFASDWDEVETSLYFLTMISARLTWEIKANDIFDRINKKISETVDYMADGVRRDLMTREYRRPGITAEIYKNSTNEFKTRFPSLYSKITPEIKFLHETYEARNPEEVQRYATKFCSDYNLHLPTLVNSLKVLSASVAGIQGSEYTMIRLRLQSICSVLSSTNGTHWYANEFANGYGFETYRPEKLQDVPRLIFEELKSRDTGNEFVNFGVKVMKMDPPPIRSWLPTVRRGANELGQWLDRDSVWSVRRQINSYNEQIEQFKGAYKKQTQLRKSEKKKGNNIIESKIEILERAFMQQNSSATTVG